MSTRLLYHIDHKLVNCKEYTETWLNPEIVAKINKISKAKVIRLLIVLAEEKLMWSGCWLWVKIPEWLDAYLIKIAIKKVS